MRTLKLQIAYDGSNYCGWQIQPNGRSIQGTIQDGIRRMTCEENDLVGAARTDAGVHALGQVAHFRTERDIPCAGFLSGINSMLPLDIRIVNISEQDDKFHSQHAARGKRYVYRLLISKVAEPLLVNRAWLISQEIDIDCMKSAIRSFVGKHDFESFRAAHCTQRDANREIWSAEIIENDAFAPFIAGSGKVIDIAIEGDGFVRHMIRNIAGTVVDVGLGKIGGARIPDIILARDREAAGLCAPACGLYLEAVYY